MANTVANRCKYNLAAGLMDLRNGGDTIKLALVDSNHSIDPDDDVWGDVSANELETSGTGYSQKTLANQALTQDDANDVAKFDADDVQWTSATFTARYAILYDDTIATDDLIGHIDFTENKSVTSGTFTIQFASNGVLQLS